MTEGKSMRKSGSISRRRLLTTVGAGAVLAASPFRINLVQAEEASIKIGFPVPLTGPYGTEAQDQVRAAGLAVAQFNDAGGLDGRKAELVVRDDKLNPGEAATRTLELVEKEKVSFVVGSLSAAVQLAINNVTKERGVIFNSISQSDAINEAADFSKYTFHEALNPHITSGAVGRYAFPKFGKKVVFLTADYAYGHEMVRGFLEVGKAFDIENLADIRHPIGTTDYSTLLPRIQALKPDILCICNFGRDQQISLKQATDFGLKQTTQIIAPLLSHASRVAAGPQAFEGVIGGCSFYWGIEDKFASTKAFNDAFRKMYDGKVLLILASEHPPHVNLLPGWQDVVPHNLTAQYVDGHHRDLLKDRSVPRVTDLIVSHLTSANPGNSASFCADTPGSRDPMQTADATAM